MKKSHFHHAANACLENGKRLLNDAEMLEYEDPPATAFALVIIAQEEFAKSFLLTLVHKDIIQWNKFILRAAHDHKCKQLLVMVMDFLNPSWDDFMTRDDAWYSDRVNGLLPSLVADALNIFRHEKIGRWEIKNWFWEDPPVYEPKVKKVANGFIDKWKQDQLYIGIGKDGTIEPRRLVTNTQFEEEKERANRLSSVVKAMLEEECKERFDYKLVFDAFQALFKRINSGIDITP
ncbi:MAG: AbiV family abortive infection protein [Deltaproteobacteria bacterium]|nr:AbiV family abortive infection protein [Deltaproteobacteria bacterium]